MLKRRKKNSMRSGFSLLELVIAIFILTVGITGALRLIVSTIQNSIDTRNGAIASGLAQEGAELVRNIRDNNMLYALSDLSLERETAFRTHGFPPPPTLDSNCRFDYTFDYLNPVTSCGLTGSSSNAKLFLTTSNGFYTHTSTGNTETIFKRYVSFAYDNSSSDTLNPNPVGVNIVSYVWWGASKPATDATCNLANKCVLVKDYLPKRD